MPSTKGVNSGHVQYSDWLVAYATVRFPFTLAFARPFSLLSRMSTGREKGLVSGKSRGAPFWGCGWYDAVGCDASLISANKVDLFKRSRASRTWLKAYRPCRQTIGIHAVYGHYFLPKTRNCYF